ncbi:MFS transporter [Arthrobacter ginkgonis]|uniref:MFS transporter n=1 Tax=Arthrobacter ginkgonis TaxID=1630594 RepID=A0ABP7CTG3_9MICC
MTEDLRVRESVQPTQRSAARAWLVTVMLVLLALVNWGDKAVLGLVAVPLMKDLGIGPAEYGLLASSLYFLFSASAVTAGFLANRIATKWLLFGMVVIWSICQFSIWLAPTFAMVLASRILLGFGEGPSAGLSFHAAAKWFRDEERNVPIALQNVGAFGGIAVAAPGVTYVATTWGWHWAFFAVGIAGIVWLVAWLFIGKEGPYSASPKSAESAAAADSVLVGSFRAPYGKLMLSRTFIGCCCVSLAAYWALAIVSAWLPTYLQIARGYSPASAAQIVMGVSLSAIVFLVTEAFATNILMKRGVGTRVARGVMAAGSTAVAGVFILLGTFATAGTLQIVLLCIGFGLGLVTFTTGAVMISEFVPVLQRGAVLGIYVAIITSAGIFAPTIFGGIVQAQGSTEAGYQMALTVSGVVVIVGGLIGLVLIDPKRDANRIFKLMRPTVSA